MCIRDRFRIFQQLPESLTVKNSIYSSHPDNKARIEYLEERISDTYGDAAGVPAKSEIFDRIRSRIVEANVRIRLNDHQYELALVTLEEAEKYYKRAALIQHYRGEAYRLKADNPDKAAKEIAWLSGSAEQEPLTDEETEQEPGDEVARVKTDERDLEYFIDNKAAHYSKAESFYNDALKIKPDLALAYKGLGLVCYSREDYPQAVQHLNNYLEMAESPPDRLYIKRIIRNSKQMEANHD